MVNEIPLNQIYSPFAAYIAQERYSRETGSISKNPVGYKKLLKNFKVSPPQKKLPR
jgi:hypothetical protein